MKKMKDNVHEGDLIATPGVIYDYTSVGGSLYARGADTKTAFPKLTSVGGYLDASGAWSHVKTNVGSSETIARCRAALLASFAAVGFSFADGVLAKIVSQRGNVSRVIICGKTEVSYLVTDGSAWSHGETLKAARDGLLYKVGSRDTSEFKAWARDKKISKRDAIRAYRTITGACEAGVKNWMSTHNVPESLTVGDVIAMTKGAFGAGEFAEFFRDVPKKKPAKSEATAEMVM